jgi:hypothetical protein
MAGATSTSFRTFTPLLTHFTLPTLSLHPPRSLPSSSSTHSLRPPTIIPQLDPFTHLNSIRSPPPSLCPPSYTHSLTSTLLHYFPALSSAHFLCHPSLLPFILLHSFLDPIPSPHPRLAPHTKGSISHVPSFFNVHLLLHILYACGLLFSQHLSAFSVLLVVFSSF